MNYLLDSDITMSPQFSVSTSEKRGEFSRFVSSGETSELYTWYKIFTKVLDSGRYKFTATISEQSPSKNNILGFSTQPDLYGNSVTFETNDKKPITIYLGLKKNSKCLISNILLERVSDALPPRPPFIKPPIQNEIEIYTNQDDNREKKIIWTKGVKNPPKMGGIHPDFRRTALDGHITYDIGYTPGNGWHDANKDERTTDDSLCFIAAATNSLYWWFDINKEYINRYFEEGGTIPKDPNGLRKQTLLNIINGERPQRRSNLWEYFHARYGGRTSGGFTDVVQDQFINGYWFDNPDTNTNWPLNSENNQGQRVIEEGVDSNGGFFYNIFNIKKLTNRTRFDGQNLPEYTRIIKETLENGGIVCPSLYYALYGNSGHIITMWGAEFNIDDGSLSAIYVSDSDDAQKDETFGMERRVISTKDGEIKMTTQADGKGGAKVYELNTLMAGTEFWEAYFNKGGNTGMGSSLTFQEKELKHLIERLVAAIPDKLSFLENDVDFIAKSLADQTYLKRDEYKPPVTSVNGKVGAVDIKANDIKFADEETFQQKLDTGKLKGVDGANGTNATINGQETISILEGANVTIQQDPDRKTITISASGTGGGGEGLPGKDGFSPTVTIQEGEGQHTITIRDKDGEKTTIVKDGKDGVNGKDGANGTPGKDGQNGQNGQDGKSAYEIAKELGKPNTESESGWIDSLKGEPGVDGKDGAKGHKGEPGAQGLPGENGFSPTVEIVEGDGTHTINITDKEGLKSTIIKDGKDGIGGGVPSGVSSVNSLTGAVTIIGNDKIDVGQGSDGQIIITDNNLISYNEDIVGVRQAEPAQLTIDRYQKIEPFSTQTIKMPLEDGLLTNRVKEIHLYTNVVKPTTLIFEGAIKWQTQPPKIESGFVYEFIFTYYQGTWLGGVIKYE